MSIVAITVTPTITAGAYDAADAVGGLLTFANAASIYRGAGRIIRVGITDKGNQKANLKLWLWKATFTAAADGAAFDPTDADLLNCLGYIEIPAANYMTATDNSAGSVKDCAFDFVLATAGTSLFGQLQCVATPTYTSTSDLQITLTIER